MCLKFLLIIPSMLYALLTFSRICMFLITLFRINNDFCVKKSAVLFRNFFSIRVSEIVYLLLYRKKSAHYSYWVSRAVCRISATTSPEVAIG